MKLITLFAWLVFPMAAFIEATPVDNKTQEAAFRQLTRWQKQSQQYIEATVKTRYSGCIADKVVYRQDPRCLVRDINLNYSNQTKPSDVTKLLSSCTDLGCFDTVHAGGHFSVGGLGYDAFSSPGDPVFYLHHAQVDHMWTVWQNLDPKNRTSQVYGTQTSFNGEWLFYISCSQWMLCAKRSYALSPTERERDTWVHDRFWCTCTSPDPKKFSVNHWWPLLLCIYLVFSRTLLF